MVAASLVPSGGSTEKLLLHHLPAVPLSHHEVHECSPADILSPLRTFLLTLLRELPTVHSVMTLKHRVEAAKELSTI